MTRPLPLVSEVAALTRTDVTEGPAAVDIGPRDGVAVPSGPAWAVKRGIDVIGSALLLVLVSPLIAIGAVGIKLTSPGPVFFRQQRVGRGGSPFGMFKLRTFPVDHQDVVFSIPHADCPLRFQRLLRRTSIDELPQLANVLLGDMSLVGPRPERPHFAESFNEKVAGYSGRTRVRGGITGLAQVTGMVGNTSILTRCTLDNQYIDEWSLLGDVKILLRTIPAVVRKIRS